MYIMVWIYISNILNIKKRFWIDLIFFFIIKISFFLVINNLILEQKTVYNIFITIRVSIFQLSFFNLRKRIRPYICYLKYLNYELITRVLSLELKNLYEKKKKDPLVWLCNYSFLFRPYSSFLLTPKRALTLTLTKIKD